MNSRSRFLRLFWRGVQNKAFTTTKARDGFDYVVPIPMRGPVKAPRSLLERRIDDARR